MKWTLSFVELWLMLKFLEETIVGFTMWAIVTFAIFRAIIVLAPARINLRAPLLLDLLAYLR